MRKPNFLLQKLKIFKSNGVSPWKRWEGVEAGQTLCGKGEGVNFS